MTHYYTLMSCNGLEWIQPPSNESRLPGCYAYYDPPARIVDELNRLVDRNKRLEDAGNQMELVLISFQIFSDFRKSDSIRATLNWLKTKEAKL